MISKEDLEKFKELHRKEFGEDISDAEALDSATNLVDLVRAVYKPIKKSDYEKYSRKQE